MECIRVKSVKKYLSAQSELWQKLAEAEVAMMPTPLAMQPTQYIRESWKDKRYGQLAAVHVSAVHDGERMLVKVRWQAPKSENSDFPDALAVALPVKKGAPLVTMGSEGYPIQILRWSSKDDSLMSILAEGIGKSRPGPAMKTQVSSAHADGQWTLVIARDLGAGTDIAPLKAGVIAQLGFAVWRGANDERAGIKAFSGNWTEMAVQA